MFRWMMNILTIVLVTVVAANYFYDDGHGFGFEVHPYVYYAVGGIVAFLPVFWAVAHVCGGVLLGVASGGILEGLRLGLLLGLGMALAKLWPAALGVAAGAYLGDQNLTYTALGLVAGLLLFALDWILGYFWKATTDGHGG